MSPATRIGLHAIDATPSITDCLVKNAFTYSLVPGHAALSARVGAAPDRGGRRPHGGRRGQDLRGRDLRQDEQEGRHRGRLPETHVSRPRDRRQHGHLVQRFVHPRVVLRQHEAEAGRGRRVLAGWAVGAGAIQYTHPWNDDPVSMLEMPMRSAPRHRRDRRHGPRARARFAPPSV